MPREDLTGSVVPRPLSAQMEKIVFGKDKERETVEFCCTRDRKPLGRAQRPPEQLRIVNLRHDAVLLRKLAHRPR
jgi:hypothetical protein